MSFLTNIFKYGLVRGKTDASGATVLVWAGGSANFNDAGFLGASPDATAAVNAASINAALAGGGVVTLMSPGTFLVDSSIVLASNTRFVLGDNTTIKLAPQSNVCLVKNQSSENSFSAVAGITSSADVASVNWVAHGLAVGDYFTVLGMDQNDYAGVWKVVSVADADNFTYHLDVISATSPCTGTILGRKCDHDITIEGGTFDWDQSNQTNPPTIDAHTINMINMANYREYGVRVINNKKYSRNLNNVRDVYVKDGQCYSWAVNGADGWHVIGPQRGVAVFENLTGTTGDDFIGLTTGDVPNWTAYFGANQIEGDIAHVRIVNAKPIHGNHSIVKFDGSTVDKGYVIKTCEIDGLHGTTIDPPVFALVLSGVDPLIGTRVNNLIVRNITARSLTAGKSTIKIENNAIIDKMLVEGVRVNTNGASSIVRAGDTSTITQLEVRDVVATIVDGGAAIVDMTAGATFGQVLLDNYRATITTGGAMRFDGAVTKITASNGYLAGGGNLIRFTGSGTPHISVSNCTEGTAGGGVYISQSANLFTRNWYHNSGAAAVTIAGGTNEWHGEVVAATPLSVTSGTVRPNGTGIRIATALATYKIGYTYYDTTLSKLRIGGASAWETVTSA